MVETDLGRKHHELGFTYRSAYHCHCVNTSCCFPNLYWPCRAMDAAASRAMLFEMLCAGLTMWVTG